MEWSGVEWLEWADGDSAMLFFMCFFLLDACLHIVLRGCIKLIYILT